MGAEKRRRATSYLTIQAGTGERQIIVWDTLDITVGRSERQDIVIANSEVSREHALFRRRGEACEVEDLNSGLGTIVDGKPIKIHGLQHGNVIQIGTLEIEFGQSAEPLTRGKNVRFASELKEFGLPALEDGADRTMLAFDSEDDLLPVSPSASASASSPRTVTKDGTVEIDAPGSEALDLGAEEVQVRNLDLDLREEIPALDESAIAKELAITAPARPSLEKRTGEPSETTAPTARLEPLKSDGVETPSRAADAEVTTKLVLEVKGPAAQVEAFLEAIRDKRIQLPPIELLVRDI
jgi:pSer/pThr/pTyr-binding forkhead associated (FHA) protein